MNVIVKPVPVGDMAGALAYFVTGDGDLSIDNVIATIVDNHLKQPRLVVIEDRMISHNDIEAMAQALHNQFTVALVTTINAALPTWNAVHRVVLVTTSADYTGLPAHEVHMHWTEGDDATPVVAPLGAAQTHIYATTQKGKFPQLIEWARTAPYPIGVISRTL